MDDMKAVGLVVAIATVIYIARRSHAGSPYDLDTELPADEIPSGTVNVIGPAAQTEAARIADLKRRRRAM